MRVNSSARAMRPQPRHRAALAWLPEIAFDELQLEAARRGVVAERLAAEILENVINRCLFAALLDR